MNNGDTARSAGSWGDFLLFIKAENNDPQCDANGYNQYGPHSAVDGDYLNFASGDSANSVYVDAGETRHWWRVDLQSSQNVAVVRVWARVGCDTCSAEDRMLNFEVVVGESAVLSENSACATGLPDPQILLDVHCPRGTMGRYVFLALPAGTNTYFNFAQQYISRVRIRPANICVEVTQYFSFSDLSYVQRTNILRIYKSSLLAPNSTAELISCKVYSEGTKGTTDFKQINWGNYIFTVIK